MRPTSNAIELIIVCDANRLVCSERRSDGCRSPAMTPVSLTEGRGRDVGTVGR